MIASNEVSQRLLRKGVLAAETYRAFQEWDLTATLDTNLSSAAGSQFKTVAWAHEVHATLRRRFKDEQAAAPLIVLAQRHLPFEEWLSCLLVWIGIREHLFREFVVEWLYPQYDRGVYQLRVDDVLPFTTHLWKTIHNGSKPLSAYGELRTARDFLRMGRDFGLLAGDGATKTFPSFHLSDRSFLFWAHAIAEQESSTARVTTSAIWRLALMRPAEVEQEILRLHQFRKLEYHVAGSLVQLTLPCANPLEYAERMVI